MLGKPENPVCPLSYNKPYQKKSSMIQKLSASIFLCLWGIVSVYGNLHPVIDKDPLSIAVEAFDNQTHPYSKERIQKEIQNRNVRWTTHLMTAAGTFYEATGQKRFLDMSEEIFRCAVTAWEKDEQLMRGRDDFFSTRNVAATYKLLKKEGRLKGNEARRIVIRFADLHFEPHFITDHNQGQERALGFTRMYNLFRMLPMQTCGKPIQIQCGISGMPIRMWTRPLLYIQPST